MNAPIKVVLSKPQYCYIPTTFMGMIPPKGFRESLLTLETPEPGDFRVIISLFNTDPTLIGGYSVKSKIVFPRDLEIQCEIPIEMFDAIDMKRIPNLILAELLASNSTLTISREDTITTVYFRSDLLGLDISEVVSQIDLWGFLPS